MVQVHRPLLHPTRFITRVHKFPQQFSQSSQWEQQISQDNEILESVNETRYCEMLYLKLNQNNPRFSVRQCYVVSGTKGKQSEC